jgi:hypothetical protein
MKDLDEGADYIMTVRDMNILENEQNDYVELENCLLRR